MLPCDFVMMASLLLASFKLLLFIRIYVRRKGLVHFWQSYTGGVNNAIWKWQWILYFFTYTLKIHPYTFRSFLYSIVIVTDKYSLNFLYVMISRNNGWRFEKKTLFTLYHLQNRKWGMWDIKCSDLSTIKPK